MINLLYNSISDELADLSSTMKDFWPYIQQDVFNKQKFEITEKTTRVSELKSSFYTFFW